MTSALIAAAALRQAGGLRQLGRLLLERRGDDVLAFTPTPLRNVSQHRLEPTLLESLKRAGGVARYLIGADGAGSPVRKSLGIQPIGPDRIQGFVMTHFEANLRSAVGGTTARRTRSARVRRRSSGPATMAAVAAGASTRRYAGTPEALPPPLVSDKIGAMLWCR